MLYLAPLALLPLGGFGSNSVAALDDVDGDGTDDLVVGAPGANRVYVFSGKDGRVLLLLEHGAGRDAFGRAVAGGGDVDGDGRADTVIGAPNERGGGRVHAFSGRDGRELWRDAPHAPTSSSFARFGIRVAVLEDLDRDGRAEVFAGADELELHGEAVVLNGSDGARRWSVRSTDRMWSRFGASVAALGDVDGDGVCELVVGDPDDSESMDPVGEEMSRGHAPGSVHVVSGRTGLRLWMAFGDEAHDSLGYCVANAGDVDGDGRDDVLSMARNGLFWERAEPWSRVYSGHDGTLLRELGLAPERCGAAAEPGSR